MKRKLNTLLLLAGAGLLLAMAPLAVRAQTTLTNDGAALTVQPGAVLYVDGAIFNKTSGTLTNNGTVELTGDLTSTAAWGSLTGAGLLRFRGTADQTLSAPDGTSLAQLEVANTGPAGQNRLLTPFDLTITSALTLTSGLVRTPAAIILTLPDGATISGEAAGRYVQGNLRMVRAAGSGVLDFGNGLTLDCTGLGQVTVTRTAGLLTDNVSRGVNLGNAALKGIDRIWTVEAATAPAAPLAITLQWLPDDDNGLTFSSTQAWQAPLNSASWRAASNQHAPTVSSTARSFSFTTAALGRLTISNAENPLPVELAAFTAERRGPDGLLRWTTATEKNNDHFDAEASTDGRAFQRIGRVKGHESTAQRQHYELIDANLSRYAAEVVYYRLRQVDTDGHELLSPVRTVLVPAPADLAVQAFPTPRHTGDLLRLRLTTPTAGLVSLLVTDAIGRTVLDRPLTLAKGTSTLELPEAAQWPQGMYLLRVRQGARQQAVKVVCE